MKDSMRLVLSISLVLVSLFSIIWFSLHQLQKNKEMLIRLVEVNNVCLHLANDMLNDATKTIVVVRNFLLDQNNQEQNLANQNRIKKLSELRLSYSESFNAIKKLIPIEDSTVNEILSNLEVLEVAAKQQLDYVIHLDKTGKSIEAIDFLNTKSSLIVEQWITQINYLHNHNEMLYQLRYNEAKSKISQTEIWMLSLGSIIILISLMVFAFILFKFNLRKKSEEKLLKLNLAISNSQEVVFMTDKEGIITFINPEFTKMYGFNAEEVVGKVTPRILKSGLTTKEQNEQLWNLLLNKQNIPRSEYVNKSKDGKLIDVEGSTDPIINDNGDIIGFLAIQRDISERKRSERELMNALEKATESDRLKSAFLATMSHELRTPLNAIIGFSDFLDKNCSTDDVEKFGKVINSSGNHLLSIVEDLFDITLIESNVINIRKEEIPLQSFLNIIYSTIKIEQQKMDKNHIDIHLIIPPESTDLTIFTDQTKLKQILINLLKNALKFTNEGYINFGFMIDDSDKTVFKFYVEDSGIGIAKDKQEIIFDVFRQADDSHTRLYGGVGIGLSIAKKLTEILGGEIWVESAEGKGSAFYFTLPIEKQIDTNKTNEIKTKVETIEKNKFSNKTVLVVEDVDTNFEFLKHVLQKSGIKTIWAKNGKEAIRYCIEEPDIAIVLMDLRMPVMNGYEATKEIKRIKPNLPIIAQTAFALEGDKEKAIEAGCDDYISKPINKNKLIEIIESYLK